MITAQPYAVSTLRDSTPIGKILPVPAAQTESLAIDRAGTFQIATIVVNLQTQRKDYLMHLPYASYSDHPAFASYHGPPQVIDESERMFHATVLGMIEDNGKQRLLYASSVEPWNPEEPLSTPKVRLVSTVSIDDIIKYQELVPK
ncbi:hypothetical protein HY637_01640 [Candidatus Woesearchaeota archaeon]|nr:hypothetical protein [Candidatus Woesearchaeota archaeon]